MEPSAPRFSPGWVTKQRREIQAGQGGPVVLYSCIAQGSGRMGPGDVEAIFSRASHAPARLFEVRFIIPKASTAVWVGA